jgi:hypothetical protein
MQNETQARNDSHDGGPDPLINGKGEPAQNKKERNRRRDQAASQIIEEFPSTN